MNQWPRLFQLAHNCLWQDSQLLSYLRSRRVSDESISVFNLGKMPPDDVLLSLFDSEWLEDAGIIYPNRTSGRPQCVFYRHPIIFPFKNVHGEHIGLAGRAIVPDLKPKYLNNSFAKKYNLYGLDIAKDHIRREGGVYVVEGYMDVIAAHAHNIKNTVAVCSANLSDGHLLLLSRYTRNIVRILDRDRAGEQSHKRWTDPRNMFPGVNVSALVFRNRAIKDVDEYFNKFGGSSQLFLADLIGFSDIMSPMPTLLGSAPAA